MTEPPHRLPTTWWRRTLAAIDALDVAGSVSGVLIATGLLVLWGPGWAMLGTGGLGLVGTTALLIHGDLAARRRER